MAVIRARIGRRIGMMVLAVLAASPTAQALMAGRAPDSPEARLIRAGSPWSGVGSVVVRGRPYSGVAVAERWVLTAAHVAAGAPASAVVFVPVGGVAVAADRIAVFPGARFPYDDLALVHLAAALPAGVAHYAIEAGPVLPGRRVILAGCGASGNGDTGISVAAEAGVCRIGENLIARIGTRMDDAMRRGRFFFYRFDSPEHAGPRPDASLGNGRETMVAPGDSGSPAFVQLANGAYRLYGISSFTENDRQASRSYRFGDAGGGVVLAAPRYLGWLRSTTSNECELVDDTE